MLATRTGVYDHDLSIYPAEGVTHCRMHYYQTVCYITQHDLVIKYSSIVTVNISLSELDCQVREAYPYGSHCDDTYRTIRVLVITRDRIGIDVVVKVMLTDNTNQKVQFVNIGSCVAAYSDIESRCIYLTADGLLKNLCGVFVPPLSVYELEGCEDWYNARMSGINVQLKSYLTVWIGTMVMRFRLSVNGLDTLDKTTLDFPVVYAQSTHENWIVLDTRKTLAIVVDGKHSIITDKCNMVIGAVRHHDIGYKPTLKWGYVEGLENSEHRLVQYVDYNCNKLPGAHVPSDILVTDTQVLCDRSNTKSSRKVG